MRLLPSFASLPTMAASMVVLGLTCLPGCQVEPSADASATTKESDGTAAQPIIGGSVDHANRSTVAILVTPTAGQNSVCSGTVIARSGDKGYVLTAAHCVTGVVHHIFEATDWRDCVAGGNPNGCRASYAATAWTPHPSYDPASLGDDYGIIEFSGATDDTAVTPVVSGADGLTVSATVELSGYGRTYAGADDPNLFQSVRHDVSTEIGTLQPTVFRVDGTTGKTACYGDSGSAAYATTTSGAKVVVGVASAADQFCEHFAVYGRVSNVFSSFIAPVVEAPPPAVPPAPDGTCSACVASHFDGDDNCAGALEDCQGNADCEAILTCVKACATTDRACFAGCETPHASGLGVFQHLTSCTACSSCDEECGKTSCGWSSQPPVASLAPQASTDPQGTSSGGGSSSRDGGISSDEGSNRAPQCGVGSTNSTACATPTLTCSFSLSDAHGGGAAVITFAMIASWLVRRRSL